MVLKTFTITDLPTTIITLDLILLLQLWKVRHFLWGKSNKCSNHKENEKKEKKKNKVRAYNSGKQASFQGSCGWGSLSTKESFKRNIHWMDRMWLSLRIIFFFYLLIHTLPTTQTCSWSARLLREILKWQYLPAPCGCWPRGSPELSMSGISATDRTPHQSHPKKSHERKQREWAQNSSQFSILHTWGK